MATTGLNGHCRPKPGNVAGSFVECADLCKDFQSVKDVCSLEEANRLDENVALGNSGAIPVLLTEEDLIVGTASYRKLN